MKDLDSINFKFYVPMYGSGAFYFDKDSDKVNAGFLGIPEGSCDVIEDEIISSEVFNSINDYLYAELNEYCPSDSNWECSIEFCLNNNVVDEFGENRIDYDKFTEILYYIINTYAENLSQYLW